MKKIALIILSAVMFTLIVPALSGPAFAACTKDTDCPKGQTCIKGECKKPIDELKELQFDVGTILDLDYTSESNPSTSSGDQQGQEYMKEDVRSPIVEFIMRVINFALTIMGSIAIVILIIGGFMMMLARGNQQELEKAKEVIKYAIMGLVIAFLAYIIVISVQSIFI